MPFRREDYPPDWDQISKRIRYERAQGQCECRGQCGLHRTGGTARPCGDPSCECNGLHPLHLHPRGPRRCAEFNGYPAVWAKGRIMLTVAHLCDCDPLCGNEEHLIAACQRCHLRIDVALHVQHRATNRRLALEMAGQTTFALHV